MEPKKYLTYEEFGAKGDGVTDDFAAICAAHKAANEQGLPVRANDGATYYIGRNDTACEIRTDVEWGKAHFILDDTVVDLDHRGKCVFVVANDNPEIRYNEEDLAGLSLTTESKNLGRELPHRGLAFITYNGAKVYNRWGFNGNGVGSDTQEVVLIEKDGSIDPDTPLLFNYPKLTSMILYSAEERPITLHGGIFTTWANQAPSEYTYYNRGIALRRSNATVDGLEHYVEKESDHGAPYNGFLDISNANHVILKNCVLTGHRAYPRALDARNVMGSYDITGSRANDIIYDHLTQSNSITDPFYWGLHGSNFTKNLTVRDCVISRIDAHAGMYNCTITNTTLGLYLNIIGAGLLYIDGLTRLGGHEFLYMRDDYGSTWEGDVVVKNSKFLGYERYWHPKRVTELENPSSDLALFHTSRIDWPFGYVCHLPKTVTLENCSFGIDGKAKITLFEFGKVDETTEHNKLALCEKVTAKNVAAGEFRLTNRPDVLPEDAVELKIELA